jgi:hypothetical protein
LGEVKLQKVVEKNVEEGLSRYKWLRGGVEIIDEVQF